MTDPMDCGGRELGINLVLAPPVRLYGMYATTTMLGTAASR